MKNTIFLKIFSGFLLFTLLLTGITAFIYYNNVKSFHINTLVRDLVKLSEASKPNILPMLEQGLFSELDSYVKDLGSKIETRITIINQKGTVLADSDENPETMEDHKFRPEVIRAFEGFIGQSIRFSKTVRENMLYVGVPILKNGQVTHVLRLSLYIYDIKRLLGNLKSNLFRFFAVIFLLSLIVALFYTRNLTRPIRKLSHASRQIASGNFKVNVFVKNKDELRKLADSFNFMSERICDLFEELTSQKEKLNSTMDSIEEGLVIINISNNRILRGNLSFAHIVDQKDIAGKYYWEVLRESDFGELIHQVQKDNSSHSKEIILDGRIYACTVNRLEESSEIVATFHDITEIKNLEKIKKEFVLNVSHELRTPLTSIKGYLETFYYEANKKQRKYLDIARRNTERLIKIVEDLLVLSELETEEIKIELKKIDIRELLVMTSKIFEQRAKEKNLELHLNLPKKLPPVTGDRFRLEQMLINLMDNAVKYTEEGEITLSAFKDNVNLCIEVSDTGIGIPSREKSRVFERFYVGNKSRSRRSGGTGLGLSIVKHIIQIHKGKIELESTHGVGTTFRIFLPAH